MHQRAAQTPVQKIKNNYPLNGVLPAIAASGIVKRYDSFTAVDDISFTVTAGDFFGFLGPNGAGKTTTINAIVGLAVLNAGSISVFGHDTVKDWRAARQLIGVAPQEYNFDRYLTIRDILIYQAGYFGLRPKEVRKRADDLLERFDLSSKANVDVTKLSGGMKRRLTLARAMVHSPKLLILDEPTAGVDVELRIELWELLRRLNAEGMTIFLTTHYLEEAEALCRNIGIIEHGKLVALEPTESLLSHNREATLKITVNRPITALPASLTQWGASYEPGDVTLSIERVAPERIATTLTELEAHGYQIEGVEFRRSTLQDVFLELTGK